MKIENVSHVNKLSKAFVPRPRDSLHAFDSLKISFD